MPRTGVKKLYRVLLERRGSKSRVIRTQAATKKQAGRFGEFNNPGFKATNVRLD